MMPRIDGPLWLQEGYSRRLDTLFTRYVQMVIISGSALILQNRCYLLLALCQIREVRWLCRVHFCNRLRPIHVGSRRQLLYRGPRIPKVCCSETEFHSGFAGHRIFRRYHYCFTLVLDRKE